MNLNDLVIEYKKTNSQELLNKIFYILQPIVHKKADYIFYQKKFKYRGTSFKLCDTKKLDLEDVRQELNVEILRIINNYDISKPFKNYLFATLWDWRPNFLKTGNFIQSVNTISESNLNRTDDTNLSLDNMVNLSIDKNTQLDFDDLFEDLTNEDRKILLIIMKNLGKTQTQLAEIIGVSQQRVSQLLQKLRKKYKFRL